MDIYASTSIILPASDSIVREHYIFDGWYDSDGKLWTVIDKYVGKSISLKAKWKGETYNINYHMNEGHFVSTDSMPYEWVYASISVTLPASDSIVREYYIFDGWYRDPSFGGSAIESIDKMEGNHVDLYAKWRGVHYFVTYHENEGHFVTIPNNEWIYDEKGLALPNGDSIKREHYEFDGWYDNNEFKGSEYTDIDKMRHESIDLYAKWKGVTYNINYHMNDGHFISTSSMPHTWIYASTSVTLPASDSIVREHYHFGGWYRDASLEGVECTEIDKMEGDHIDLYAKWIGDTYKVTYHLNGGYYESTASVVYNWIYKTSKDISLPKVKRAHYTFVKWVDSSGIEYNKIRNGEGDNIELFAIWDANTYYIVYTMSAGEFVSTYSEPTEWVYASYSVTLPVEGEIVRANYHFDGWYENGDFGSVRLYEIDKYRGIDIKITAKWIPNTYDINYHMNGGYFKATDSITKQFTYNVSDVPLHDDDIERKNYQFRGWYDNASFTGTRWTSVSKLNEGDVNLYAKWEPNVYKITYILNGGHFVGTESVIDKWTYASDSVVLPASGSTVNGIERADYHFAGWYDKERFDGMKYSILSSYTENDITLYAKWIENTYNITYVQNGGHFESTASVIKEWTYNISDAELPRDNNIKREHWVFKGWYDNAAFTGAPYTEISRKRGGGDITLYAKWVGETYNVTYVKNNGSFVDGYVEPTTWQYASTSVVLPASDSFVREHYIFRGWYDTPPTLDVHGTELTEIDMYHGENITLYALWEPRVYKINYVMNEGQWISTKSIVDNFSSFVYDGGDVPVPNMSYIKRTYYKFLGWYDNPLFSGEKLSKVSGTHPGDITLYASWIGEEYHIHYNLNGGAWAKNYAPPTTWIYNFKDVVLPEVGQINYGGYDFCGWYDNPGFTGSAYNIISKTRTNDTTLYAQFTMIPDPDTPTRPGGGGGGGGMAPGKISGNVPIKEEVSIDLVNTLDETAQDLMEHDVVIKQAIDILPVAFLIVRDHASELKEALTDQQKFEIIADGNSDYPIRRVVAWDRKNNRTVEYDAIYDRVTNKFYKTNLADLPRGWIGVPNGRNNFDWYYINSLGKKVTQFLNVDGIMWYFDDDGVMMTGMVNVNGTLYYFDETIGEDQGKLVSAEEYLSRKR